MSLQKEYTSVSISNTVFEKNFSFGEGRDIISNNINLFIINYIQYILVKLLILNKY